MWGLGMRGNREEDKVAKGLNVRSRGCYVVWLGGAMQGICGMSTLCIYLRAHDPMCPLHDLGYVYRLQE